MTLLLLSLALAIPLIATAQPYTCTLQNGSSIEAPYPCEPAMVERFGKRLIELYPEIKAINTSPDYIMGLYTFSMASCRGQFAAMTPEQIGESGEPFFPKAMGAAIARAGREVLCPMPR